MTTWLGWNARKKINNNRIVALLQYRIFPSTITTIQWLLFIGELPLWSGYYNPKKWKKNCKKKIIALFVSVIYADNNQQNRCVISRRNLAARLGMVHSTLSIFLVVIYHIGRCVVWYRAEEYDCEMHDAGPRTMHCIYVTNFEAFRWNPAYVWTIIVVACRAFFFLRFLNSWKCDMIHLTDKPIISTSFPLNDLATILWFMKFHIMRLHPVQLYQYAPLYISKNTMKSFQTPFGIWINSLCWNTIFLKSVDN